MKCSPLTTLTALSLIAAASSLTTSTFSCAISTITLRAGEPPFEVCNKASLPDPGFLSLQWITGTFGALGDGMEATLVSIFVDGEATPSVTYYPYELTAIPSLAAWATTHAAEQPPWGSPLFARNSATSFTNTVPVPFASAVRITLTYTGNASSTLYYQAHGQTGTGLVPFGVSTLPLSARLVIQRNALTLPRLAYLPIVNVSAGRSGLIAAMAIAFTAPNLNTLEGCFNMYATASTPFPGELHSTGTEDEFISSYYYDQGAFQGRNAGLYYKHDGAGGAAVSMWRSCESTASARGGTAAGRSVSLRAHPPFPRIAPQTTMTR
jgi:hypothetical protein